MLWEDLTAGEFEKACRGTGGVCVIPFGVIEKHGEHMPLGTDMLLARKIAEEAASIEPFVIFPYYYFGQINEARHVPGTISVSPEVMYRLMEEVCSEISRNGFQKIVILNSHGGNPAFINSFLQNSLYQRKDYVLYSLDPVLDSDEKEEIMELMGSREMGDHAGNSEASRIMAIRPDLVKLDSVDRNGLICHARLDFLQEVFTAISWYAAHPEHSAGEPWQANARAGKRELEMITAKVVTAIRTIKKDEISKKLQDEFFSRCNSPCNQT